ncbi:hypothetical protein BaRGS_00032409, partial [Batillaria attramentaria]
TSGPPRGKRRCTSGLDCSEVHRLSDFQVLSVPGRLAPIPANSVLASGFVLRGFPLCMHTRAACQQRQDDVCPRKVTHSCLELLCTRVSANRKKSDSYTRPKEKQTANYTASVSGYYRHVHLRVAILRR